MFRPHHKSYVTYFKAVHDKARPKVYQKKRLDLEVLMDKLKTSPCSAREFHFLFNHFKSVLGLGYSGGAAELFKGHLRLLTGSSSYITSDDSFPLPLSKISGHPWRGCEKEEKKEKEEVEISQQKKEWAHC